MRIGIANDTALGLVRHCAGVLSLPANQVAWMAKDGAEAVAFSRADAPDLILMTSSCQAPTVSRRHEESWANRRDAILIVTATIAGHLRQSLSGDGLRRRLTRLIHRRWGFRGEIAARRYSAAKNRNDREAPAEAD